MKYYLTLKYISKYFSKKHGIFKHYINDNFVETGTFVGDGVKAALKYGFKSIYSIELSAELYNQSLTRFAEYSNVHIIHGDSGLVLYDVIKEIEGKITFWLDGHYHPAGGKRMDNPGHYRWGKSDYIDEWTPLTDELKAINRHVIKEHTIIIDDIQELGNKEYGDLKLNRIKELILEINPDYKFKLHDGARKDDVLVAFI